MSTQNKQQGFTAADMADQYATAFERGKESVLAERAAAAQEAVAWFTDDHLTDKSATTFDPVVAERWRNKGWPVTNLYAAPVAAAPVVVPMTDSYVQPVPDKCDRIVWRGRYYHLPVSSQSTPAAPEAVAYLDIGAGGYLDIGSDLPEEQLLALPNGRHALGIIGTYGIDGYVSAPVTAAPVTVTRDADGEIVMVKQGDTIIASTCHAGGKAPAAPGIDLATLREIASDLSHSAKVDDYMPPQQVAFIESIRDRVLALIDASPKGSSDV